MSQSVPRRVWESEQDVIAWLTTKQHQTTIWRVEGELTTESGSGGRETWYYLTKSPLELPDLTQRIYAPNSSNGRDWYLIHSVTAINPQVIIDGLLTKSEVVQRTTLSYPTIWRRIKEGKFPAPVQVSSGRVAWLTSEVQTWIDELPRATGDLK